jgi:N6-adenosine-specific RNA methylase IME4
MTHQPALFPDLEAETAAAALGAAAVGASAFRVALDGWPFGDLAMFGYDLLVADPAWDFENWSDKGTLKGADPHYRPMPIEEIRALPVGQLARGDCLLLCWATGPMLPQQIATVEGWGFTYKTELVWAKTYPSGKPRMGTGYRARSLHESVIVATIGAPQHKPFRSLFSGIAREHSRKPEAFFRMIDECCPRLLDRAELFARQRRPGYAACGNEITKFGEAA